MGVKVGLLILASFGFDASTPVYAVTLSPTFGVDPVRERARAVLKVHCGQCHDPVPVPAQAKALAIYDLSEKNWSARLSDLQLKDVASRLADRVGMTPSELIEVVPKGGKPPARPTAAEVAAVGDFVSRELGHRSLRIR